MILDQYNRTPLDMLRGLLDEQVGRQIGLKVRPTVKEQLLRVLRNKVISGDGKALRVMMRIEQQSKEAQIIYDNAVMNEQHDSHASVARGGVLTVPRSVPMETFYAMLDRGLTEDDWEMLMACAQHDYDDRIREKAEHDAEVAAKRLAREAAEALQGGKAPVQRPAERSGKKTIPQAIWSDPEPLIPERLSIQSPDAPAAPPAPPDSYPPGY